MKQFCKNHKLFSKWVNRHVKSVEGKHWALVAKNEGGDQIAKT